MKTISLVKAIVISNCVFAALTRFSCEAHNENVHRYITRSAFYSSSGVSAFLSINLQPDPKPLTAQPHGYGASANQPPETWLEWGAYYEDMEDPLTWQTGGTLGPLDSPRAQDHFYTVTFQPTRIPGQVIGLTDNTEHFLSPWGTNSYAWGAIKGIRPVIDVKPNDQTWPDARGYEFAALTNTSQSIREQNLALMLDSLGHVLHLNQDLTSPDHVRNDNHYIEKHRYFENYGQNNYLVNPQWFNQQPRGWSYWQSQGFTDLLNFWDTGKYVGNSAAALNQEAQGNTKLGLAEFSNGNFLGEDALYNEVVPGNDTFHHFPFPSRDTSTQFKSNWQNPLNMIDGSFLKNGTPIKRVYLQKTGDGIQFRHHSVLGYLDVSAMTSPTSVSVQRQIFTPSIDDSNVLQDYHSILIPKAVEYSAGVLDYFFRGALSAFVSGTNFYVQNVSGQDFYGGMFYVFEETNAVRTLLQQFPVMGVLPNGGSSNLVCSASMPSGYTYLVVYQGTIGVANDNSALDPVDANIGLADAWATCYDCQGAVTIINDLAWTVINYPANEGAITTSALFSGTNGSFSINGGSLGGGVEVLTDICNPTSFDITLAINSNITWATADSYYEFLIYLNNSVFFAVSEYTAPPSGTDNPTMNIVLPAGSVTTIDLLFEFDSFTPIDQFYGGEYNGIITLSVVQ